MVWWDGRIKDATSVLGEPWFSEGQTRRMRKAKWEHRWPCRLARRGGTRSLSACDISGAKCWAPRRLFEAEDKEDEGVRSHCFTGGRWALGGLGRALQEVG